MRGLLAVCLALAGCATTETVWVKPGSTQNDFYMDGGQCRAQAAGASPYMVPMQIAIIYSNCMAGKGWHTQEVPIKR